MIRDLSLENFLFISKAQIDFSSGLNVITGETGAGKSVLLEALKLLLGKKGKTGLVKAGQTTARLQATFSLEQSPAIRSSLEENGLLNEDDPQTLIISRTFRPEGTEKVFVNGILATTGQLRDLGRQLLEIHGQNEHQTLLESRVQRRLLDRTGGEKHLRSLQELETLYRLLRDRQSALQDLEERLANGQARQEELERHLSDLKALALGDPDEESRLKEEAHRMSHIEQIAESLSLARAAMTGVEDQDGATRLLFRCRESVRRAEANDTGLRSLADRLETLYQESLDIEHDLEHRCDTLTFDPQRNAWIQARLAEISRLCRRHGCDGNGLFTLRMDLEGQLAELTAPDTTREKLKLELEKTRAEFEKRVQEISTARRKFAANLEKLVSNEMSDLGFPAARFRITLNATEPGPEGAETVDFVVALNPGGAPGSLRKIASGGELSRVALALKKVLARSDELPSLVFDEIDTGVGGTTAEAVGRSLKALGEEKQVLLVTHLHQIAKEGDRHFVVSKAVADDMTSISIAEVKGRAREGEIARMLGATGKEGLSFARSILRESAKTQ